jgi:hypothetical protein
MNKPDSLPYHDTKPVGAADFYFAINATWQFVFERLGMDGLRQYWKDLGTQHFAPVSALWKQKGLEGVATYWRDFFRHEPGAEAKVKSESDGRVVLDIKVCPAIKHLREHRRKILPCYCQHCYFISEAMGAAAGITVRVAGGNGKCRQVFQRRGNGMTEQDISKIREVTC